MESYGGKDEVVNEGEKEDDEEVIESTSGSPGDDRPFILFEEWIVNDFLSTMLDKVL